MWFHGRLNFWRRRNIQSLEQDSVGGKVPDDGGSLPVSGSTGVVSGPATVGYQQNRIVDPTTGCCNPDGGKLRNLHD